MFIEGKFDNIGHSDIHFLSFYTGPSYINVVPIGINVKNIASNFDI